MTIKSKIPQIRFKGFSGEWDQHKLGELLVITSASRVHKNEWTESGVRFFRSSDVVSDYKGFKNNKVFISFDLYKELSNKSGCVQKNDLLVTGGGSIGIPYLVKTNEPLYFKDADLLWLKNSDEINGYFLYTFFSTLIFRRYVSSITHIGTISHYTIEQAKSTPINISIKNEQDKIGDYFQHLDKLIEQKEKKYQKLRQFKKAMLDKMFPKNGATTPEIRFKGFSDKWEKKILGNVVDFYKGSGLSKTKLNKNGKNHCILYGELFTTYDRRITKVVSKTDFVEGIKSNKNDILIPSSTTTKGIDLAIASAIHLNDILLGGDINILRPKIQNLNSDFLAYYLTFVKTNRIAEITQGTTIIHLYGKSLVDLDIDIPNIKEQTKICNLFIKLDKQIDIQQKEIEKLKNIKKASLDKMFV